MPARDVNEYRRKNAWNAKHYETVTITLRKQPDGTISDRERLKALAGEKGMSVSRYIIEAVNAYAGETVLFPLDDESKKKH